MTHPVQLSQVAKWDIWIGHPDIPAIKSLVFDIASMLSSNLDCRFPMSYKSMTYADAWACPCFGSSCALFMLGYIITFQLGCSLDKVCQVGLQDLPNLSKVKETCRTNDTRFDLVNLEPAPILKPSPVCVCAPLPVCLCMFGSAHAGCFVQI